MTAECLTGPTLPPRINDLSEPPQRLYLTGQLPPGPLVALVGTRRASAQATEFAEELSYECARRGVVVASGGALGIDSAAHRGALLAGQGTLVVAPASFDCSFPVQNRPLFEQVVAGGGGYLSMFQSDTTATRASFFQRNSLLVALSSVVVLVEAPARSGARNAALWSRRLSRPLYVVPSSPWHEPGYGGLLELKLGALPLVSYKDVLARLKRMNQHVIERPAAAGSADTPQTLRLPWPPSFE